MIFESLWPLALLAAVPVVIILYLLKPRGKDYRISSNLLWEALFKNQESRTFLEKFIHNILMYLQILILLLLVLSLMSPYLNRQGRSGGNVILVFDTSGSMQHDSGDGRTRMEEALEQAKDLIAASEETVFSIVTADSMGTELPAAGVRDKDALYRVLEEIVCCDGPGNLQGAESIVETLRGAQSQSGEAQGAEVIVFTDGSGAQEAEGFCAYFDARLYVAGSPVDNVSNNFLSYVDARTEEDGSEAAESTDERLEGRTVICASSLTNHSDARAAMEISLYEGGRLLDVQSLTLDPGETRMFFFDSYVWQGGALRSEVSSVRFSGRDTGDSLAADNTAYAIIDQSSQTNGIFIGEGNIYLEKAYQAVVGTHLTKVADGGQLQNGQKEQPEGTVYICDAGESDKLPENSSALLFGDEGNASGTVEGILLTVTGCDLTSGLSAFSIGVNETKVYDIPAWGNGFLWAGDKCAGYYGEHDGVKRVVVGFDLRESDFPLKAEFPVFISNALHFLGDTFLLAENLYMAGNPVLYHPQAEFDVGTLPDSTRKAGLFEVSALGRTEQYVVRFAAESESDGRITAEGTFSGTFSGVRSVKLRLRSIPLVLVLLLLAAEWVVYVRQTRYRGKFYPAIRIIGAALVFLALLGVSVKRMSGMNTTVFLVDISNSNQQNLSAMEDYLDDALRKMPRKNQYGIVTFGKNSLVDQFLTGEDRFSRILSLPDKTATNFEEALSRALAMIPAEGAGRVVVLTDGKETKGNLANTASALVSRQVELLARVYETKQGQDAYLESVELPSYLYQGDLYSMTVTVESNYETDAQIQIWMGSMQKESYDVHLSRGSNQFRFQQTVTGENIENFEVRVAAPGDTVAENDSYHAYSVVDSVPKILLVSGMDEDSSQYENLLRSANCSFDAISAINAPDTLEGLLEYKSVILENVYLSDLPEGFLANIEAYVGDYGCGLVCCGGEDSFALGGYRESVLEKILPVDMELRGVDEVPVMAMIMVIDHSGSMSANVGSSATNLDLAITAAQTAVDQMRETDYVGVITFDDKYAWVVEPVLASDKDAIKEQIATIPEGGGTTIQPALREALEGVSECDASIRHVVLLTDGQGESNNYSDIITAYTDGGVTLSTVAIGIGSDAKLLETLAEACGGRHYYSDFATDIPKIFAQEVFLSGDTYLQNGDFALSVNGNNELTRGLFASGWPNVYGYVSATPKNMSTVLIASEKDDPLLTIMQYGLGHTVAWNTDVTNMWTAAYAGKDDYAQLWRRIIDYSSGSTWLGQDSVDVATAGGYTNITYSAVDYDGQTEVEAVYTDPEGHTWTAPLRATAPGRYETRLDTDSTGLYSLSVRRMDNGTVSNAVTTAAVVQYSDEYKFSVGTEAFTGFVQRYGRLLEPDEDFWKQRKSEAGEKLDLTVWLILLAFVWFLMDIALRRFCFLPQDTKLYRMVSGRIAGYRGRRGEAADGGQSGRKSPGRISEEEQRAKEGVVSEKGTRLDAPDRAAKAGENPSGKGKARRKKGKAAKEQGQQTLDTAELLKKKDQRGQ